ncbi:MAG: hypothetical protein QGH89_02320 [Candidatus Marinimicrobia bacterium]|jgi:hypothetical protein|nr:hypothetical protein [Candidatus Neomarinimicrobiota bacterium]
MKVKSIKILSFSIACLVSGCAIFRPLKIAVPAELNGVQRMPVGGGEKSVQYDIGPFHIFQIESRPGKVLYTDFKSSYYDIKAFEYKLKDPIGNVWDCWCEYPQRSLYDERVRCNFQDQRNPNIRWSLVDSSLTSGNTEIKIRPYYESEEKRRIGSTLMGYSFAFSDTIRALVDISSARNEAVWIHPNLETHSALATAAASSAFILKHRQLHYSQQMDQIDARSDFGM